MKTKKISLANIQDKMSRTEMKNIMAGVAIDLDPCKSSCAVSSDCPSDRKCGAFECAPGKTAYACFRY